MKVGKVQDGQRPGRTVWQDLQAVATAPVPPRLHQNPVGHAGCSGRRRRGQREQRPLGYSPRQQQGFERHGREASILVAEPGESLKVRLSRELREAMKAREALRVSVLRLLTASVKNREIELGHPLTDEEFQEVARREVKRRREAIEAYEAAGREDRAAQEREEQAVLETYLPAGLSDAEVDVLIEQAIAETGASAPSDLGKVMGLVMGRAKGRTDGRAVQERVRRRLGS